MADEARIQIVGSPFPNISKNLFSLGGNVRIVCHLVNFFLLFDTLSGCCTRKVEHYTIIGGLENRKWVLVNSTPISKYLIAKSMALSPKNL